MTHDYLYSTDYNNPIPCGVYCLMDIRTTKLYVGSTVDLTRRASQHFRALEEGVHHNRLLQYDWDLNGPEAFSFIVLERVRSRESLEAREQVWLDRLKKKALNIQRKIVREDLWKDWQPVDNITLPWEDQPEEKKDGAGNPSLCP